MQVGHSVLVTGFTARLPAQPGSTRRPSPATVAARGPSPPGPAGMPPGRSQASPCSYHRARRPLTFRKLRVPQDLHDLRGR